MTVHTFKVENIHCSSCENDVRTVVKQQEPDAAVSFLQNSEIVQVTTPGAGAGRHEFDVDKALQTFVEHGFVVSSVDEYPFVVAASPSAAASARPKRSSFSKFRSWISGQPLSLTEQKRNHAEICEACGIEDEDDDTSSDADNTAAPTTADASVDAASTTPIAPATETAAATTTPGTSASGARAQKQPEFRALFSVKGMSCASCSAAVTSAITSAVPSALDISVDPIKGAAYVLLPSRNDVERIVAAVSDAGYEATLTELLPLAARTVKEYRLMASVSGMTCSSCSTSVKHALEELPFVSRVKVEALDGKAEIVTTSKAPLSQIIAAVEDIGYGIEVVGGYTDLHSAQTGPKSRTVTLEVRGIFCEHCPDNVMNALRAYGDAVEIVNPVTTSTPYVKFTYLPSPPRLTIRSILRKVREASPELEFDIVHPKSLEEIAADNMNAERAAILRRLLLVSVIALPTVFLMFTEQMHNFKLMLALSTPVYLFAADMFHRKAIKEIRTLVHSQSPLRRRLFHFGSMSLLMSLGTSISYWASIAVVFIDPHSEDVYFDSVIFLTFFLLVGRYLDIRSKIDTASSVSLVSKVRPDTVDLWDSTTSTSRTLPVELIDVGDIVALHPGGRCAIDGEVIQGATDLNESMLTGEALPVPKKIGDEVYAGTLNSGQQTLVLKVTAVGKGTLLDDIVDAVRSGQMQRAPIERYVEQFTGVFVPLVTYLALLVWLLWYIVSKDFLWSSEFAIATFVVACPCGIGLAAPTALYIGSGLSAKYGILARGGGEAFQEGARLNVLCFDKTGTITKGGELRITDTFGAESDEAVQLAARLETGSTHPLAAALIAYADGRNVTSARCAEIVQVEDKGRGMFAKVTAGKYAGKTAVLGNEQVIREVAETEPSKEQLRLLQRWKSQGKSVILLAIKNEGVILMLAIADELRPESRAVIHVLTNLGIQCWLVSGDNAETARAVAAQVGIPEDRVIAGVLPQQKLDKVKALQMTGGANLPNSHYGRAIVGMVGDGINDAPALATSDVGIALGRGADIALSSSQFILLREDLRGLPVLVELSKAVIRRVKLNFFWAGIYNIVAIPVAAGVFYPWTHSRLDPVWASLAMALSSVSVMTSSLLLRRFKPNTSI